jgi:NAD+ synthase
LAGPLAIDEGSTADRIAAGIRTLMHEKDAQGVLLGLSGGIDSSLLAALAVRAGGPQAVHAIYLYDRHSSRRLRRCARTISNMLGLDYREQSITAEMEAGGLYSSAGMRLTGISGWLNRTLYSIYHRFTHETPFLSTLKAHDSASEKWFHSILGQAENGMNARHRYRRTVLEALADDQNWLLLGAANRSELLVGWFVKGGVDDLPLQPLLELYKTQVRQLAGYLKLPECVLTNRPSPDMLPGVTDESAIGLDYTTLDLILAYLQGKLGEHEMTSRSIGDDQIEYVRKLMHYSAWKRSPA